MIAYMIWIDYIIISVVSFFCLLNTVRGFTCAALSLITWFFAIFISSYYYNNLSIWLICFKNELIRNGISIFLIFIVIIIVGTVLKRKISYLVEKAGLSGVDRILGFCFGILYGIVIILVILFLLDIFTEFSGSEDWKKSKIILKFNFIINLFFTYLYNLLPSFLSRISILENEI